MVTDKHATSTGPYRVLRGRSTNIKPTNVANGSEYFEIDTGKNYYFDGVNKQWYEQPGVGPSIDVQALTLTGNGTTTAPEGTAYSPVTVAVPVYDGTVEVE